MSIKIDAAINEKAFLDSVNKGVRAYNRKFGKSGGTLKLKIDEKGFRQPLGRITGDINMFDSALAASNARVIAFGASTAVIGGVSKAFRDLAKTTIEVQKAFADINRILQLSNKNFETFGNKLFEIGKKNATAFQDTTKAALEFARQGLKVDETLKRTSDALTLVRLTGINADKAVSSLTATVNAFDDAAVTTTSSINKFVAVETKFAVGARDLVEAIGRVGSSAKDAKVGFDELNAMVTAVQQSTGRGGAVIGNAMKTIFTRLQRQSTLDALDSYNVAVKDIEGNTLPAVQILDNLAQSYSGLADNSQAYLREQVAGVFQANILSAILRDLAKKQSTFGAAMKVSTGATNEADLATAKLNQTLSVLISQTGTEFQRLQQNIGKQTFEPIAKALLDPLKEAMEGINEIIDGEGAGSDVAGAILKGIKNVIGGPGLIAIGTILFTVFKNTIGYMVQAIPQLVGLTTETQKRATLEGFIEKALQSEANLAKAVASEEGNAARQAKLLMDYATITAGQMEGQEESMRAIAGIMLKMPKAGATVATATGGGKGAPRGAGGFIPGMAGEVHDIRRGVGGVSPSSRAVSIPNFSFGGGARGTMIANTGEYMIPNYRGGGSAIFNPEMVSQYGMPAGARPIRGAKGYVPNFVDVGKMRLSEFGGIKPSALKADPALMARFTALTGRKNISTGMPDAMKAGYAKQSAQSRARRDTFISKHVAMLTPPSGIGAGASSMHPFNAGNKVVGMKGRPFNVAFRKYTYNRKTASSSSKNITPIEDNIENGIIAATRKFAASINPPAVDLKKAEMKAALNTAQGGAGAISSAAGAAFEVGISQALGLKAAANEKGIKNLDVPMGFFTQNLKTLFSTGKQKVKATIEGGDFKVRDSKGNVKSMAEKIMSPAGDPAWPNWVASLKARDKTQTGLKSRGSRGYVPNFAALGDAVEREVAAGAPLGSIRVNRSSGLVGPNNPAGIAVTNTRDEPRGLKDVTGASRGYVPNYVDPVGVDFGGVIGKANKQLAGMTNGLTRFQTALDKIALKLAKKEITEEQAMRSTARLGRAAGKSGTDLVTLGTRVKTASSSMAGIGGKGGLLTRAKASMKQGGGLGVGIGLAMGLPMAAGAVEQGFGEGSATGQVLSGGLSGAGTGASMGMMFGPWGAAIGAAAGLLGGLGVAAMDAGKSLELLKREAEEWEKQTTDVTAAGREYIQAQEDLLSATTTEDLESAQKAVIKNFEAIKGTNLQEAFTQAGTDVKLLTAALKDYEEERGVGSAIKKAGTAAAAADDTKWGKFFGALGGGVEGYLTETAKTTQGYSLGTGARGAYVPPRTSFSYSLEDENIKALQKDYGDMFKLFATEMSVGQLKELSDLLREETSGGLFSTFDSTAAAKLVIKHSDRIGNEFKTDLDEFFQNLEDATSGKLFTVQDFSTVISRVNAFGEAQDDEVKNIIKFAVQATQSFTDIKDAMKMVAIALERASKFAAVINKGSTAMTSNVSGILRTQGNELGAVGFERAQGEVKLDTKKRASEQKFISKNIASLMDAIKKAGGIETGDKALSGLHEASDMFTKDIKKGFALLEAFTGRNKSATAGLVKAIQDQKTIFEDQERGFAVDRAMLTSKFDLEEQKAKNLIKEKALQGELRDVIHARQMTIIAENAAANKEEIRARSALEDRRTFAGMTGEQELRARQDIQRGLTVSQLTRTRREGVQESVKALGANAVQKEVVDSNLLLLKSQNSLNEAIIDLTVEMSKFAEIARIESDTQREIVIKRSQAKSQRNLAFETDTENFAIDPKTGVRGPGGGPNPNYGKVKNTRLAEAYEKMGGDKGWQQRVDKEEAAIRTRQTKKIDLTMAGTGSTATKAGIVNVDQLRSSTAEFEMQRATVRGTFDKLQGLKSIKGVQNEIDVILGKEIAKGDKGNVDLMEKLRALKQELHQRGENLTAQEEETLLAEKLLQSRQRYNDEVQRSFSKSFTEGFQALYRDTDYIFGRLGRDLPAAFRDGMVGALEEAMDKTESLGDAMRGFAVDMLKMVRHQFLQHSMSNFTNLLGLGASPGFRNQGPAPNQRIGGVVRAQRGMYISTGASSGDSVPAMLEKGEYVLNREAVAGMGGKKNVDRINFGAFPRQNGGSMMLNESVRSPRMSGFFLASDNPELTEAREAARAKYEEKQQKKAEKRQLLTAFLSTLASAGIAKASQAFAKPNPMAGAVTAKDLSLSQQVDLDRAQISAGGADAFAQNKGYMDMRDMERAGSLLSGPPWQKGGHITGGFRNRDSVPAFMAGGEYVMNSRAVRKYGLGFMGRLNGGLIPGMQAGGAVGGASAAPLSTQTAANTNNISINVSVGGGGSNQGGSASTGNVNADQESNRDQATEARDLSERIRGAVLEVISQEQRLGGSLSKNSRQG
jgi:TP901 family phage tail tape measure protein